MYKEKFRFCTSDIVIVVETLIQIPGLEIWSLHKGSRKIGRKWELVHERGHNQTEHGFVCTTAPKHICVIGVYVQT